jgi:Flp pilus assembly protein TadB
MRSSLIGMIGYLVFGILLVGFAITTPHKMLAGLRYKFFRLLLVISGILIAVGIVLEWLNNDPPIPAPTFLIGACIVPVSIVTLC